MRKGSLTGLPPVYRRRATTNINVKGSRVLPASKDFLQATGCAVWKSNLVDNFFEKVLDTIAIDNLYKAVRAIS
jgi:hypothetical protein